MSLAQRACGGEETRGGRFTSVPIGQQLWEQELESYKRFPPLQARDL
jgi:hypothetical protein